MKLLSNIIVHLINGLAICILLFNLVNTVSCANPPSGQLQGRSDFTVDTLKSAGALPSIFERSFPFDIDQAKVEKKHYAAYCSGFAAVGLPNEGDITFDSPKKTVDRLTLKEKALLSGFTLEGLVYSMGKTYLLKGEVPTDLADVERYKKLLSPAFEKELLSLSSAEQKARMAPYLSPVTGKILRFNSDGFEPGQSYITIITSEILREKFFEALQNGFEDSGYPKERIAVVYYRVYGEEGVIAEEITEVVLAKNEADEALFRKTGLMPGTSSSGS